MGTRRTLQSLISFLTLLILMPGWLSAQEAKTPRLYALYEGAFRIGRAAIPEPGLIAGQADWDRFRQRLPETLPDPNVMGGAEQPNRDPIRDLEPDFSRLFYVVVFQSPSRSGPLRFDGIGLSGKKMVLKTSILERGPEARPTDLGFYTAFEFPRVAGMDGTLRLETATTNGRNRRWMKQDEGTGLYGIMGGGKPGWVVKPTWSYAFDFDPWEHAVVAAGGGFSLIDGDGRELLRPMTFDNGPDYFVEGLARFQDKADRVGYYDMTGTVAIPARFDFAQPFQDGVATVTYGGKRVADGEHSVWSGGKSVLIDDTGRELKR